MDFLKSQLEAEQKSSEEAKKGMESMRQKLEDIRDEFRIRMLEAEQSRKNSIEVYFHSYFSQYWNVKICLILV